MVSDALVQVLCIDAVDKFRQYLYLFLNNKLLHTGYKGLIYSLYRVSARLLIAHALLQHKAYEQSVVNVAQILHHQTWKLPNNLPFLRSHT